MNASRSILPLLATTLGVLAFAAAPAAHAETGGCLNEQLRTENGSLALPDCRAYEQVTPAEKNGTLIGNPFIGLQNPQISENGQRVIDTSIGCFEGAASCIPARENQGVPYEFDRTGSGWVTHTLAPPATLLETWTAWSVNANGGTSFNPEGGTALFSGLAPGSNREVFWARQPDGAFTEIGPLEETESFGRGTYQNLTPVYGVLATADLSHVLYQAENGAFWTFGKDTAEAQLYEYAGAGKTEPLLVGVKGGPGSHELISTCETDLSKLRGSARFNGSLSETGRTVYFIAEGLDIPSCASTATAPAASELFARVDGEAADAHSVLISGPTAASCTSVECKENTSGADASERARDAQFEGASVDGSDAFFASEQQLTDSASEGEAGGGCDSAGAGGCNLYESVCAEPCATGDLKEPEAQDRELIDVDDPDSTSKVPGGARVQGVEAISADGSHVYFVAQGVLTGGQENAMHETAADGADNLYAYERDAVHPQGSVVFVARLAEADAELNWDTESGDIANISPDGGFLVFTSHRALTADDTRTEAEGEEAAQVYEYDAGSGTLRRVSVGQGGYNDNGNVGVGDATIVEARSQGVAAGSVPVRSDPSMSANGEFVFFRSPIALTPGALNDVVVGPKVNEANEKVIGVVYAQNYYEWHDGVVSLISDGKDTTDKSKNSEAGGLGVESATNLLGADSSGANVFFSTFDPLVPGDTDTQLDFYDARIQGGVPALVATPSCEGEACQGTPSPAPVFAAPSSATLTGSGNLAPPPAPAVTSKKAAKKATKCKRGFVKNKQGKCIKNKQRAKTAGEDRRAK